jgi:2-polyprenyl-3-methyl-5-hydroxy-6-metoxy-1,4-benzoquinol methylase
MPKREGGFIRMETLPIEERRSGPGRCQDHWHRFLAPWVKARSVLDVGAGHGFGMDIMHEMGASSVCGIDPLPLRDDIFDTSIEVVQEKAYDVVTACDVIEHIEDDVGFFRALMRVAREYVFISTPNWNISHAENQYHAREYTPDELHLFLESNAPGKHCTFFSSDLYFAIRAVKTLNDAEHNFGVLVNVS